MGSESCDDANYDLNDGCDECSIETGWNCTTGLNTSICTVICGDGQNNCNVITYST